MDVQKMPPPQSRRDAYESAMDIYHFLREKPDLVIKLAKFSNPKYLVPVVAEAFDPIFPQGHLCVRRDLLRTQAATIHNIIMMLSNELCKAYPNTARGRPKPLQLPAKVLISSGDSVGVQSVLQEALPDQLTAEESLVNCFAQLRL